MKDVLKIPFGTKQVLYGKNSCRCLAEELKERNIKRVFICTDKELSKTEMFQDVKKMLEMDGLSVSVYNEILPNPLAENIEEGKRALLQSRSDCVIGFGGGSSMDAAKMIAALAVSEGSIIEYTSHYEQKRNFNQRKHYLVGIPTTAGTGSEMDNCACVVDYDGRKLNVFSDELYCDLAVIDSTFLYGCPKSVIAACGIDALCHSLEHYIGDPEMIFDVCALKSIDLIVKNLQSAYENKGKIYRDRLAMASFLGGVVLTVGVGARSVPIHSIALPVSLHYHLSHGESLAAVLPYVLDLIIEVDPKPTAEVGRYVGITEKDDRRCAKLFCAELQQLIRVLELEFSKDVAEEDQEIKQLASMSVMSRTTTHNEILPCDFEKCCSVYRRMFHRETIELQ